MRFIVLLALCVSSTSQASDLKPRESSARSRDILTKPKPTHRKKDRLMGVDLTVHRVSEAIVQIPSVAPPIDKGQLNFNATINFDPNVFIGAAAFWIVTMMAAHSDSAELHKLLCGTIHIGPAMMDSGFGLAFAGTF